MLAFLRFFQLWKEMNSFGMFNGGKFQSPSQFFPTPM